MSRGHRSGAHDSVVDGETESRLQHEDEEEGVDVVTALATLAKPLTDDLVTIVLLSVTPTDMPREAERPEHHASIENPGAEIDWLSEGKLCTNNDGVGYDKRETPCNVNVTVVCLYLAENVAYSLGNDDRKTWPQHVHSAISINDLVFHP